ncbi:Protein shifted [Eumeta japonica]|uniref:Protein shifted n=1 Tax=Eumeta variegata TaxID=151549 RepID=A0A4C1T3M4_EUMVA|nr:Protein shifted [Eumeta japonica]
MGGGGGFTHSVNSGNSSNSLTDAHKVHGGGGRKGNKQRRAHHRKHSRSNDSDDNISLWINEQQLKCRLPCSGNNSGTAMFNVGLTIHNRSGNPLPGTPLRLNFKEECTHRGVYDNLDASHPTLITPLQEAWKGLEWLGSQTYRKKAYAPSLVNMCFRGLLFCEFAGRLRKASLRPNVSLQTSGHQLKRLPLGVQIGELTQTI